MSTYAWPRADLDASLGWKPDSEGFLARDLPETAAELAADSRWPGFFPCSISIVTASDGTTSVVEKVVGASIVNRFPYVVALSFCVRPLSERHHPRSRFLEVLERGGSAAIQFIAPGGALDAVMSAIAEIPEESSATRLARTGLASRPGPQTGAPVFEDAYLVYEARLVEPGRDIDGRPIYPSPWLDVGSHRICFLEIVAIHLRRDIARGERQILWHSLPEWTPPAPVVAGPTARSGRTYQKGYTPHYRFPSAGTIAFRADREDERYATKILGRESIDALRSLSDDDARWPCFFPSSVGMIGTSDGQGGANLMPCGSTTVVSRQPLVFAICVSYADINVRYAPRESLRLIRATRRFACGVPFVEAHVLDAIRYAGNVSIAEDSRKLANVGLSSVDTAFGPILADLPMHFLCEVIGEHHLGTHAMFLGEAKRILARRGLSPANPMHWSPWASVAERDG